MAQQDDRTRPAKRLRPRLQRGKDTDERRTLKKGNAAADVEPRAASRSTTHGLMSRARQFEAQTGNYANAIRDSILSAILSSPPTRIGITLGHAEPLMNPKAKYERASEDFDQGLKLKPKRFGFCTRKRGCLPDAGKYSASLRDYWTEIKG